MSAAPAMAAEPGDGDGGDCVPAPATSELAWNIKDSFIRYISGAGSIEYGGGAEHADDLITWGPGSGTLDASGSGTLSFPGTVHLSAHGGALDMTFSDLRVDTTAGTLVGDMASKDMSGGDASVADEVIAKLEFSELGQSGGEASAILTEAAAGAFGGSYDAGTELAGLTFTHAPAVECPTEPDPADPTTSVSIVTATADAGLVVTASGHDYVDLPKASTGAPAMGVYAALIDTDAAVGVENVSQDALRGATLADSIVDGAWQQTVTVPAADLDPDAEYDLITWSAHGDLNENTMVDRTPVTLTDAQKEALFPDDGDQGGEGDGDQGGDDDTDTPSDLSTSVKVTAATAEDGLTIDVSGAGYTDLPVPTSGQDPAGVYAALRDATTMSNEAINKNTDIVPAVGFVFKGLIRGGAWTTTLAADASKLSPSADYEVIVWSAHGDITEDTLIDTRPITLTDAQREALFGENTGGDGGDDDTGGSNDGGQSGDDSTDDEKQPGNGDLRPEPKPAAPNGQVVTCTTETIPATAGTPRLSWGVKSSFATYIQGGVAKGSISTSNGAARGGGTFSWGTGSGSLDASGLGTLSFPGVVHFTGHGDILNTRISDVRIKITGAHSGVLIANVQSQDMEGKDASASNVTFANLSFSSVSASGGTASATLTAAGAKAFAGFYDAGTSLDRVTVSMSGATAERTVEVCYDADGNRVNADGTPYSGPDGGLAHTGLGHSNDLLGLVVGLTLAGAVLLVARSRRTGRVGPARR